MKAGCGGAYTLLLLRELLDVLVSAHDDGDESGRQWARVLVVLACCRVMLRWRPLRALSAVWALTEFVLGCIMENLAYLDVNSERYWDHVQFGEYTGVVMSSVSMGSFDLGFPRQ